MREVLLVGGGLVLGAILGSGALLAVEGLMVGSAVAVMVVTAEEPQPVVVMEGAPIRMEAIDVPVVQAEAVQVPVAAPPVEMVQAQQEAAQEVVAAQAEMQRAAMQVNAAAAEAQAAQLEALMDLNTKEPGVAAKVGKTAGKAALKLMLGPAAGKLTKGK